MEPQKDNLKATHLSTLNVDKLGFFNHNAYFVFLYKKTKSLSTALYMITDHFPNEEPLKWNIRRKSLELLEATTSLPSSTTASRKEIINHLFQSSLDLLSSLDLSALSGIISEMNHQILRKEFENLLSLMEGREESLKTPTHFVLDEEMFKTEPPSANWNLNLNHTSTPSPQRQSPVVKDSNTLKDKNKPSINTNRKAIILEMLKKKTDLSIKEISLAFPDCSEKTIQRELSTLVDSGRLKKAGERRWSKYSLAN